MTAVQVTDHADRAQSRLRQQFRNSVDMVALSRALGTRTQGIEDALWSIREAVRVSGAGGRTGARDETQVRVGQVVGCIPYGGEGSGFYEFAIDTQVAVNQSNCTVAEIIQAQFFVLYGLTVIVMDGPDFPGTSAYGTLPGYGVVVVEASTELVSGAADLVYFNMSLEWMRQTTAAGIRVLVGGWTPPDINDPGTLFRLDASVLDDPTARLYTMLDRPQR